jgi:hypothetical protein
MRPTLWPGVPLELCRYVDGKPSPARRAEIAVIVADIRRRVDHLDVAITGDRDEARAKTRCSMQFISILQCVA